MNPTAEQIEQCAQVCWAAQRELRLTQFNDDAPMPWAMATDSDKQGAREKVCELWHRIDSESKPLLKFEDLLAFHIVTGFQKTAWIEELHRLLCISHFSTNAREENNLREYAAICAQDRCCYFNEGSTPQEAHDNEMQSGS